MNPNQKQTGVSGILPLTIIIEGREFQWKNQYITGKEIRDLAGLPTDADVYLGISDPWDDEQVFLSTSVDLAREGVEAFYVRNALQFVIEGKNYESKKQYVSGAELRKTAGVPPDREIYLLLQKPYEDELIEDKTQVNLARPGLEVFHVKKKDEQIIVSIKINDKSFDLARGTHKVSDLKKIGGVAATDELSELRNGKLFPLNDNASVMIKGGEEFFSCKREGSSS